MRFVYFNGKHVNRDKVHYIGKEGITDGYRVYLVLGEEHYFISEFFQSEEKATERYYEVLGNLNGASY